jgi:aryl sulfotransferase
LRKGEEGEQCFVANSLDVAWPLKTGEMHHMNSTVWNEFKFRADDIVVATYGKSGTT